MLRRTLAYLMLATLALAGCSGSTPTPRPTPRPTLTPAPTPTSLPPGAPAWFRQAVMYQIAPRYFNDSDGDGVGDLRGIADKLDYLHSLGVTTLWLTSVLETAGGGDDVIDHLSISPELGAQEDLIHLLNQAHQRGMRVLIDLAAGRTSTQHPFFQEAFGNPASLYSHWYLWGNAAQTEYQSAGGDKSRPLLDTNNYIVQRYLIEVALYWMDPDNDGNYDGVDGFVDNPEFSSPGFWKALRAEVKRANPNCLLAGYAPGKTPGQLSPYYDNQLDAVFDLSAYTVLLGAPGKTGDGLLGGQGSPAALLSQLSPNVPTAVQVIRFLNIADTPRILSELGNDAARARQAAALLLTLPGTPMLYYGEEVGMLGGAGARQFMDWSAVTQQNGQTDSMLRFYKTIGAARRSHPALSTGGLQSAAISGCAMCLAYWRWDTNDLYQILLNLGQTAQTATVDFNDMPRNVREGGKELTSDKVFNVPSNKRELWRTSPGDLQIRWWSK